ncbi:MAG: hypothetical protein WCS56_00135 [Bacilli bacterium]
MLSKDKEDSKPSDSGDSGDSGDSNKVIKSKTFLGIIGHCMGTIDGEVIPPLIEGRLEDIYYNREVVVFRHVPGLFGTRPSGSTRFRRLTINNGILNQCAMQKKATPYWAVMDSMSELKTNFTRKQVIDLAVKLIGEEKRTACGMAWDVLRNHHKHARKCQAGMGYMVDSLSGGRLSIRARCPDETLQYFAEELERSKSAMAMLEMAKTL